MMVSKSEVTRAACALLAAALFAGCGTALSATRLTPPVRVHEHGLGVHVAEVHVSVNVRREEFSPAARVLVVLDLIADRDTVLDLSASRLTLAGALGPEVVRTALATGIGQPPTTLDDGEFAAPVRLPRGQHVRAWVAFGDFPERGSRELPERIELALPSGQRLALSRPGEPPIWHSEAPSASYGTSFWLQTSADETSYNVTFEDFSIAAGPLVVGIRHGFGARSTQFGSRNGHEFVCCAIALASDVTWPLWFPGPFQFGPFVGFEASLLPGHSDVNRRNWFGPSLGIEFAEQQPPPLHGPFPISYSRSLLGTAKLRVALVHWFGPDRSLPSFGMMLSFGAAFSR